MFRVQRVGRRFRLDGLELSDSINSTNNTNSANHANNTNSTSSMKRRIVLMTRV